MRTAGLAAFNASVTRTAQASGICRVASSTVSNATHLASCLLHPVLRPLEVRFLDPAQGGADSLADPTVTRARSGHRSVSRETSTRAAMAGPRPLGWTDGVGQAVPGHLRLRRTSARRSFLVRGAGIRHPAAAGGVRYLGRFRSLATA